LLNHQFFKHFFDVLIIFFSYLKCIDKIYEIYKNENVLKTKRFASLFLVHFRPNKIRRAMTKKFGKNSDLVLHLKKGDENAYAYLIDSFNHRLCVYANSLVNDVALSEDIVQNVFINIWEKRRNLKPEFSVKSYLYKSVYNECINQYKKNQAVTALEKKYIEGLDAIVEDKDNDALEKLIALVKDAIQELPPKCKEVFLLSKKEGLTNIEISEYLNLSKNTIERHMNMAFSRIRESVGNKTDMILFLLFGFRQKMNAK